MNTEVAVRTYRGGAAHRWHRLSGNNRSRSPAPIDSHPGPPYGQRCAPAPRRGQRSGCRSAARISALSAIRGPGRLK